MSELHQEATALAAKKNGGGGECLQFCFKKIVCDKSTVGGGDGSKKKVKELSVEITFL